MGGSTWKTASSFYFKENNAYRNVFTNMLLLIEGVFWMSLYYNPHLSVHITFFQFPLSLWFFPHENMFIWNTVCYNLLPNSPLLSTTDFALKSQPLLSSSIFAFLLYICHHVPILNNQGCVFLTFKMSMGDSRILATSKATLPCPRTTAVSQLRFGLSWMEKIIERSSGFDVKEHNRNVESKNHRKRRFRRSP